MYITQGRGERGREDWGGELRGAVAGPRTSVERGHIDVVRVGHRSGLAPEYDTGYGFAMSFGFATAFITAFARIVFATGFASGFATGITRAWSAVGFGFATDFGFATGFGLAMGFGFATGLHLDCRWQLID